jgi:hypothetical protein
MTIGVVVRVPGLGAVVGCDSRITDSDTGAILSDIEEKWNVFGTCVCVYAGSVGGLWSRTIESNPRTWGDVRKGLIAPLAEDLSFEYLAYDRTRDTLWYADHTGAAFRKGSNGVIGSGGPYAQGVLDASTPPKTLEMAERLVKRAINCAIKRQSSCGGRVKLLILAGRRSPYLLR